jgi:hypothetical protein
LEKLNAGFNIEFPAVPRADKNFPLLTILQLPGVRRGPCASEVTAAYGCGFVWADVLDSVNFSALHPKDAYFLSFHDHDTKCPDWESIERADLMHLCHVLSDILDQPKRRKFTALS